MNTYLMIEILFPGTKNIQEISKILEKYKNFGVNTNLRLAHFLAQVREEVGAELKPISENLNYTEEGLKKTFKVFRDSPELAAKYGRKEKQEANQEMIANIAYANKLGNGDISSGDGYRYRGAGCLQITGKYNFQEVQKRCVKYAGKEFNPDTLEGFIVFGMAFWIQHDLYRLADAGSDRSVTDSITAKINKYTNSYKERREYFHKIKHLI